LLHKLTKQIIVPPKENICFMIYLHFSYEPKRPSVVPYGIPGLRGGDCMEKKNFQLGVNVHMKSNINQFRGKTAWFAML
jgi:hypothetical protein